MKQLLLTFLFIGTFHVIVAQNSSATAPVMNFNDTTHDFGTIKEGPDVSYDFWFTNTGQEPLIIRSCNASCGCTTPDWTKAPIAPGQKGKITVKYTTENHPGNFNKTVYIASNAKSDKERLEIYIKGTVTAKEKEPDQQVKSAPAPTPVKK